MFFIFMNLSNIKSKNLYWIKSFAITAFFKILIKICFYSHWLWKYHSTNIECNTKRISLKIFAMQTKWWKWGCAVQFFFVCSNIKYPLIIKIITTIKVERMITWVEISQRLATVQWKFNVRIIWALKFHEPSLSVHESSQISVITYRICASIFMYNLSFILQNTYKYIVF